MTTPIRRYIIAVFVSADDEPSSSTGPGHAGHELAQLASLAPVGVPAAAVLDRPRTRARAQRPVRDI